MVGWFRSAVLEMLGSVWGASNGLRRFRVLRGVVYVEYEKLRTGGGGLRDDARDEDHEPRAHGLRGRLAPPLAEQPSDHVWMVGKAGESVLQTLY